MKDRTRKRTPKPARTPRPATEPTTQTAPAPPKAEPNEQPRSVYLEDVGPNKIEVIKALRDVTGRGLREANDLVNSTDPRLIKEGATKDEAEAIRKRFADAGATIGTDYTVSETFGPTAAATPPAKTETKKPEWVAWFVVQKPEDLHGCPTSTTFPGQRQLFFPTGLIF